MSKINALVAGATGYIGIQLVKLLTKHKRVKIKYLCGDTSVGKKISSYDKYFNKYKLPNIVKFNKELLKNVDVIFTALPNGEAQKISKNLNNKNILIDLAADFRLKSASDYLKWYKIKHNAPKLIKKSIYSLPELNNQNIKKYKIISCPGCYPTSILLPLVPLINKNIVKSNNIIIDSKSGYSGAGRNIHKKYNNKFLNETLSAYGLAFHRHNSEIDQELKIKTGKKVKFQFTPHLSPMFRGILTTMYLDLKRNDSLKKIYSFLKKYYKNHKFIKILKPNTFLGTNEVINTNNCHISVCESKYKNKIIILSAIDNLIKGGSGQAVQNMNILFGYKSEEGLN